MSVSAGLWCVFQVTLVSTAALALCVFFRKRGPSLRAEVACLGLFAVGLVTVLAPLPAPSWQTMFQSTQVEAPSAGGFEIATTSSNADVPVSVPASSPQNVELAPLETDPVWLAAWDGFVEALREPTPQVVEETAKPTWNWQVYLVYGYLIGVSFGLIRLVTAWVLLRWECRGPIVEETDIDRFVVGHVGSKRAQSIRIIESHRLTSAATTGWRRPMILLPATWREWSTVERDAVLAHELSHIRRRDWLTTFFAECMRTVHFYHPLVHWLAARLRMDQELAADAHAADQVGGPQPYLKVLTQMALARSVQRTRWPVRAFLPTRNALMRRVDMLRNGDGFEKNVPRRLRWGLTLGVLMLGVLAVGMRPSDALQAQTDSGEDATQQTRSAGRVESTFGGEDNQPRPAGKIDPEAAPRPFSMDLRPANTVATFGIRPARLMSRPSLAPIVKILENSRIAQGIGLPLRDIEQIVIYFDLGRKGNQMLGGRHGMGGMMSDGGPGIGMPGGAMDPGPTWNIVPELVGFTVQAVTDLDQSAVVKQLTPMPRTGSYGGQIYLRGRDDEARFWFLDNLSFAASYRDDGLHSMIQARNQPIGRPENPKDSTRLADFAAWVDVQRLKMIVPSIDVINPNLNGVWHHTNEMQLIANVDDKLSLAVTLKPTRSGMGAMEGGYEDAGGGGGYGTGAGGYEEPLQSSKQLEIALKMLLQVGKNMVNQNRQMVPHLPKGEREAIGGILQLADAVLANAKVVRDENTHFVTLETGMDADTTARLISVLTPAVISSRQASYRVVSQNNLKQIMLAMHNYHAVHGHFPPPVLMGPDGKTPHSWRVAILPFVEHNELYESYHFDEPWDSDHNQQILAQIPDVFKHPLDDEDSKNTSYFGLVGEKTAFGTKDGIEAAEGLGGGFEGGFGGAGVENSSGNGAAGSSKPAPVAEGKPKQNQGVGLRDITDGSANTIFVVENKSAVPWTKPVDITYDPNKISQIGGWFDGGFHVGLADGSVRFIADSINPKTLKLMIERNDGQVIRDPNL